MSSPNFRVWVDKNNNGQIDLDDSTHIHVVGGHRTEPTLIREYIERCYWSDSPRSRLDRLTHGTERERSLFSHVLRFPRPVSREVVEYAGEQQREWERDRDGRQCGPLPRWWPVPITSSWRDSMILFLAPLFET